MEKIYSHITLDQRILVEKLYKKMSVKNIAEVIGKSQEAVYRELKKCPDGNYTAKEAEAETQRRIQNGVNARRDSIKKCADARIIVRKLVEINPEYDLEKIADITNLPIEKVEMYAEYARKKKVGEQRNEE